MYVSGCQGLHHSQSVEPYLWDAENWPLLFFLYAVIPNRLLSNQLFVPLGCTWPFLVSLCTGLLWLILVSATTTSVVYCPELSSKAVSSACYCHKNIFLCHVCLMLLSLTLLLCCCCASPFGCSSPQSQPELRRNALPPINLERWYQDIMAAGEPQPCPPPLPAKSFSARRHGQVNPPFHPPPPWIYSWLFHQHNFPNSCN